MSVGFPIPAFRKNKFVAAFALLAIALFFAPAPSLAETTVSISRTFSTEIGDTVTLAVQLDRNGPGPEFGAFEFVINYTAFIATLISVEPGAMVSGCGWEQFEYQLGLFNGDSLGTIRVSAVADVATTPGQPSCYLGPALGSIVNLKFHVPNEESNQCQTAIVRMNWLDCSDNSFTTRDGDSLYVAGDVQTLDGFVQPVPSVLGTDNGLPEFCIANPIEGKIPFRAISCKPGIIDVKCEPQSASPGDLNQNGIAYEIADEVLYINYFLEGPSVFSSDPVIRDFQIGSSDANADGTTLTFRDLTYLLRVINGDALPIHKLRRIDTLSATFTQDFNAKTISVDFAGNLSGAYLEFTREIVPTFFPAAPFDFVQNYAFDGTKTHLVTLSGTPNSTPGIIWLSYTGEGVLTHVGTADFNDNYIQANLAYQNAPTVCGDVNFDNMTNISDAVYLIGYIFAGGPPPIDLADADVDCDGMVTVSDAVYLINYIFAGGSAPCADCP